MKEQDIQNLLEPVLSLLLKLFPHFHVIGNVRHSAVFLYFDYEDFIELFDNLYLETVLFFNDLGVDTKKDHYIIKVNFIKAVIIECREENEIKRLYEESLSII